MTSGRRDRVAQAMPSRDLRDFPRKRLSAGRRWFRQHGPLGPWFFDSGPGGRFNLDPPRGTLYLATTAEAAARERIGFDLAEQGWVPAGLVSDRTLSELELPQDAVVAHLTASAALAWGVVSSELSTSEDYVLTRAWAAAFDAAGFDGLWSRLRFTAGQGRGVSLFGEQGARAWPTDPQPRSLRQFVAQTMRLTVVDPPSSAALTVLPAPDAP